MSRPQFVLGTLSLSALVLACVPFACSAPADDTGKKTDEPGQGDSDDDIDLDPPDTGGDDVTVAPPTKFCGDSKLDADEACDDGAKESGDGCGGNCRYVEPGYVCPDAGEPCRPFAKCGDGIVVFPEQCDDGATATPGCSATCKVELGHKCEGSPSVCTVTECGDGKKEGAETCDDENTKPLDGCSPTCQVEPKCDNTGCTSECGDGLVLGDEECDDANSLDGDGCSEACKQEPGYMCQQSEACTEVNGICALSLPIVVRDFVKDSKDFGKAEGNDGTCDGHITDLVANELSASGKPVLISNPDKSCITSADTFSGWYEKTDKNAEILETIVLFQNESGSYVNRMDNAGTRFEKPPANGGLEWCSNDLGGCDSCRAGYAECLSPCTPWGNQQTCARYEPTDGPTYIDGNPLFFPIDTHPDALANADASVANIPNEVYGGEWKADPSGTLRNFFFTSETTYWFKYKAGEIVNLNFVGDDDVWVFLNRRLAVDLGGIHVPTEGSFTIQANGDINMVEGAATRDSDAATFGLSDGGVYEIKVFQAERKKTGSSFKLTLSGFNASRSECTPDCGDGILAAGEQCDNGDELNVGGHNGCSALCELGAYCGDGVVQAESEQCDDADPDAPTDCYGCRVLVVY